MGIIIFLIVIFFVCFYFLSREGIRQDQKVTAEQRIKASTEDSFSPIRDALRRDETTQATTRLAESGTIKSDEFYSIIGELDKISGIAVLQGYIKHAGNNELKELAIDEKDYKLLWKRYEYAQKDCLDFFGQTIEMRNWITARSLKKNDHFDWKFIDAMMALVDSYWASEFRQESWWRVPFIFYVVGAVEERHGPASCTSKRWRAAHEDLFNKETIMKMIESLSEKEIAYYRCTD